MEKIKKKNHYKIQNKQKNKKLSQKILPTNGIICVNCTNNNTILTFTNGFGSILAWSSAGTCGFKNSRKSTTYSAEVAAIKLSEKIHLLGFNKVSVKMKGLGRGKKKVLTAFSRCGLSIDRITENCSLPFNGCRRKRKRRI